MAEAWVRVRRVARAPHMLLLTAPVKAIDSANAQNQVLNFCHPRRPEPGVLGPGQCGRSAGTAHHRAAPVSDLLTSAIMELNT